jgi:hypothetical protein
MAAEITMRIVIGLEHHHDTVSLIKSKLYSIMQPLFSYMTGMEFIYDQFNEM